MASMKHAAERKAAEVAIRQAVRYIKKDGADQGEQICKLIDLLQKILGNSIPEMSFDNARKMMSDPDNKWSKYVKKAINELDENVVVMTLLNLGFEAFFLGTKDIRENRKKYDCNIPWLILMDPTSACNLHCTGCWAAEYGHKLNLTYEKMDDIINQGVALGTHFYLFTGGEPLVRKNDIVKLAEAHHDCEFHIFTNGTLIDEQFCKDLQRLGNISLALSLEGFEEVNDGRRGQGVYDKVMHAFELMKAHGLLFGTSICYTRANISTITDQKFLDMIVDKGCRYAWYFHYMPVGNDADASLLPTMEQREFMYHKVREIRHDDMLFTMDFQNDGEFVGGCIAGGRNYCHINSNGDVEPCVFIHYSGANINEKSLIECLQQPLFQEYRNRQPFNKNLLRPCPMLENPQLLQEMVQRTGAHSTDLTSPESVEHLCAKCEMYAKEWHPNADRLWNQKEHPEHKYENFKNWHPKTDPKDYYSNEDSLTDEDRADDAAMAAKLAAKAAAEKAAGKEAAE
ncbi:MAG: radical SAM protein [Lachnospiraceae bacterium]|jgi:MoaA/NifB/PqqE/SkfB family radical SAM enzyme|nr:radical SAM protein [Lachnospiraceae bacterium]